MEDVIGVTICVMSIQIAYWSTIIHTENNVDPQVHNKNRTLIFCCVSIIEKLKQSHIDNFKMLSMENGKAEGINVKGGILSMTAMN